MENELIKRFEELLHTALSLQSTDISFDLCDNRLSISLRYVEGIKNLKVKPNDRQLLNMLKYQAHLDVSSDKPQSGSFEYCLDGNWLDFRLACVGYLGGSNSVLRILNCHKSLKIEQLCCDKEVQQQLYGCLNRRSGLILFAGLTGSGKTTSMYSLLNAMKNRAIYSLEDPIEIQQKNIIQLQINEKIGFDYDEGIRQILRHNPDVLMIGEIRDEKTAKMTVRAALSGCLVISSIHASASAGTISRLLQLGVGKEDLKDVLACVFFQRLCHRKDAKGYTALFDVLMKQQIEQVLEGKKVESKMAQKIRQAEDSGLIEKVISYE